MQEQWASIHNFEGIYEVSSLGRVRTTKGKTTHSELHGNRVWKQRILRQKTDQKGYKRVTLWKNKKPFSFLVHRLVASAFIPEIDGKEYINHIDGNPSNNYKDNLEWCNHSENLMHAYENRLNKSPDPIILRNLNTKEVFYFYSKAEASGFLGRNHGFVSRVIKDGKSEVDEYEIYSLAQAGGVK